MRLVSLRALACVVACSVVCSIVCVGAAGAAQGGGGPISGFDDPVAQHALEARLDSYPKAENLREWMRRLSSRPHNIGTAAQKENAEWLAAQYRAWGYETKIEQFDVLFPTPTERRLELVGPERYTAKLEEPALPEDKTSDQKAEQLPTYNAYSTDGDVTGDLVYVNYGVPADYERLAA